MTTHVTRRQSLLLGAAAAGMALSNSLMAQDRQPAWIDAHSHIWTPDTARWPLAAGKTKADLDPPSFTDDELLAVARPEGVTRVVLIAHSIYYRFDNGYLLDAARRHPERFRVVGMVDDHGKSPGAEMKRLLPQRVTGFRITPFIRTENPDRWLGTPGMHQMWKTAAETRQAMCCLIDAKHLPGVAKMCEKYPETPVVIDHFARIGVDGQMREEDLKNLCALAAHKHTAVKISAYYALGKKQPPHDELIPMIRRVYDAFGPDRLMWASDSPYQLQKGNTYKSSISLVRDRLDFLKAGDKEKLLSKTAERVFFFS